MFRTMLATAFLAVVPVSDAAAQNFSFSNRNVSVAVGRNIFGQRFFNLDVNRNNNAIVVDQFGNPIAVNRFNNFRNNVVVDRLGRPIAVNRFNNFGANRFGVNRFNNFGANRFGVNRFGNNIAVDRFGNRIVTNRFGRQIAVFNRFGVRIR